MPLVRGLALAVVSLLACNPAVGTELLIGPIGIDSVEVLILESAPPQVDAHVQGVLGDGCSELHSVEQERSDQTVTLTILKERPKDAVCTQIAKMYDEVIRLEGTYPAATYTLRVNDFETTFTTE